MHEYYLKMTSMPSDSMVCPICLSPRLEMVTSACQHRFCVKCVYTTNGKLRASMKKCPTCQKPHSLPDERPIIPEDSIEIQRILGVVECCEPSCDDQFWSWEREDHMRLHHTTVSTTQVRKSPDTKSSSSRKLPVQPNANELISNSQSKMLKSRLTDYLDSPRSMRKTGKTHLFAVTDEDQRYPLRKRNGKF